MEIEITQVSWVSLIPSLVTITLAFKTRQVLLALFAGILSGGICLYLETGAISSLNIVKVFLLPSLGSESYAVLLLIYLWCLGGILGLWAKSGSALYFAENLGKKIAQGPRSSLLFSWGLGMLFHQGGTISTILTGTTVKPVSDHYHVSHEELAYVVDSTASPVATIIPFNAWPLYIGGLVIGTIPLLDTASDTFQMFLHSLPYNYYAIIAVTMTFLFALNLLPWVGPGMKAAITRSRTTKQLDGPNARPLLKMKEEGIDIADDYLPSYYTFIIPISILLGVTIIPFTLWKFGIIEQRYANWTNEAFLLASLSAMIVAKIRGMSTLDIIDGFISGCKDMTLGAVVLGLAITMGLVAKELQTAAYLTEYASGIPAVILPAALMFICMLVAFSTGTSFGTYAVVFPVAIPLAYAIHPDITFVQVCFGAVLGGTVFGDQCSPISDTTILSSMFTGCDLMDHVKTQLPLAMVAAIFAGLLSTISAWVTL